MTCMVLVPYCRNKVLAGHTGINMKPMVCIHAQGSDDGLHSYIQQEHPRLYSSLASVSKQCSTFKINYNCKTNLSKM
jgi:hypothetical protein